MSKVYKVKVINESSVHYGHTLYVDSGDWVSSDKRVRAFMNERLYRGAGYVASFSRNSLMILNKGQSSEKPVCKKSINKKIYDDFSEMYKDEKVWSVICFNHRGEKAIASGLTRRIAQDTVRKMIEDGLTDIRMTVDMYQPKVSMYPVEVK